MTNLPNMPGYQTLVLCFPQWVCIVFSLCVIGLVFYAGHLHEKVKRICSEFPGVRDAIIRISEALVQKGISKIPLFSAASPIKLTPAGEKLVSDIKFTDFYNTNKKIVLARVVAKGPKTLADLEEAAKTTMLTMEDTMPGFELIKQAAYQNGVALADILFACAIKLRDMVAAELNIIA